MRAGRIVAVVVGALLAVVGLGAVAGGAATVVIHATARDGNGYYTSPVERVQTSTAVLVSRLDLGTAPGFTLRVTARPVAGGGPLFMGIGPRDAVDGWLAGTRYERVTDVRVGPFRTLTRLVPGSGTLAPPQVQGFWAASATGTGDRTLTWRGERGHWELVLMNADASGGVLADVSVGVRTGLLLPIGALLLGIGALLLLGGGTAMVTGVRGAPPAGATVPSGVPGSYPVRLDARPDDRLNRWLWLVKWLLLIPHLVVLALLWLAVVPLTFVAGVAILCTGRYPRALFDVNVGVMRWTWRVSYYGYSALGTDRYPPFSLRPDPTYPADLTVDYPAHLSRGLVLVKWWLLALPHYLVVAVFAGGWTLWADDRLRYSAGGGLIGLLVLVAAVILLFSGRYPKPLYDFVLGMNRWCFRVLAYAALMRDEYPPFRLDTGGPDPGTVPAPPPVPPDDRGGELVTVGAPDRKGDDI